MTSDKTTHTLDLTELCSANSFTIESFLSDLSKNGCTKCNLGLQPGLNGVCLPKGNYKSQFMIIGEAPGRHEDIQGKPFVGPAGQLLEKIWASVGMDLNDWFITNTVLCRPIAAKGSGKENFTPKKEQRANCSTHLKQQLYLVSPKIIVTLGLTATRAILGEGVKTMASVRGQIFNSTVYKNMPLLSLGITPSGKTPSYITIIVPMIHPAALLRGKGTPRHYQYRKQTYKDVKLVKSLYNFIKNGEKQ